MNEVQMSLLDEANKIDALQDKLAEHKTAFRVAYDFLEKHYPPANTQEYWTRTADDMSVVADDNKSNKLCWQLLTALLLYLDRETRSEGV